MRKTTYFMAILLAAATTATAQYGDWTTPTNVTKLNTTANDGCPNLSKDGLSVFFASTRPGGRGGFDVYVATRQSTSDDWGTPVNLGVNVNSSGNEICPALTLDERRLFFVSDKPGGCGKQDIYMTQRRNKSDVLGWEPAVNLGCTLNSIADDFGPAYYEDDDTGQEFLYFSSNRLPGKGGADIYLSARGADGNFGAATLVDELSTAFDDARPSVRHDGLEIVFDSTRPGGLGGSDLWIATRESTKEPWTEPVWVPELNSSANEVRPSLSFHGTTLYFTSNRPGSLGGVDIWQSTRPKLRNKRDAERDPLY